ncbi:MAG: serine/threonine protein kinase, partial [Cyclobacteriaceae bacterium]
MAQEKSNIDIKVQKALQKKYEIDGLVGTGGMAVVYKAVQKTLDRTVAIKVVHQNFVHDKEFIDRFIKEARVAASLNHPNIITIHDVDSVDDVHYMTMEYLDGESLSSKIRRKGTLGATETLKIVLPIAKALNYLHKQGFIHRDVKSSNIYVSNDGRPVLMDFGIVFSGESMLSQPGTVLGTPEFMSPEQANGQELSGKSDLYSLGVIMYECLTAQMPFRTDNPLTTVYKVINEAPRPLSSINPTIPEWLNSQVMNLLSKNPEDRVSSGREFAVNLLKKEVVPYNFEGLAVTTYDPPKAKTDDRTRMMGTGGNLAPNVG